MTIESIDDAFGTNDAYSTALSQDLNTQPDPLTFGGRHVAPLKTTPKIEKVWIDASKNQYDGNDDWNRDHGGGIGSGGYGGRVKVEFEWDGKGGGKFHGDVEGYYKDENGNRLNIEAYFNQDNEGKGKFGMSGDVDKK